jgi:branched-chain amino acid transport system substrate-binding protein
MTGGPFHWNYHAFWTVSDVLEVYMGMWNEVNTNKVVGILMDNTPDGVSWSALFAKVLPENGFKAIDLGRFPVGQKDYTTYINAWKKEKVEIIAGCLNPPDWATAWRQCQRQGLHPKVATPARASLFPSAVGALGGELPNKLSTEVWWSIYHPFKSSLTGESSEELCKDWMAETGKEWTQPIGFKHAGYEIAVDALKRAQSLDKEKVRQAIAATDLNTIVGHIKYNKDHYSRTPLVGGQWSKGMKWPWKLDIVYNKEHPNIPKTGKMVAIP